MADPLTRETIYKGVTITVTVNAAGGRRFRWRYVTSSNSTGHGITDRGLETAYDNARRAAEVAIDS